MRQLLKRSRYIKFVVSQLFYNGNNWEFGQRSSQFRIKIPFQCSRVFALTTDYIICIQLIYMQIQLPQHTKQMGKTVDVIGLAIWPEPLCFQSNRTYFGESTAQEQRTQKQLCTLRSNEQQLKKCNNIRFSVCNHSFMRRPCLLHDCVCARARARARVCVGVCMRACVRALVRASARVYIWQ